MNKDLLLTTLITSRRQLDRYLFYFEKNTLGEFVPSERLKINESLLTTPGVIGIWSVRDLLAYLVEGEQSWLVWWNSFNRSDAPIFLPAPEGPDSTIVQRQSSYYTTSTLDQTIDIYRSSFPELLALLDKLPEASLFKTINRSEKQSVLVAQSLLEATVHRYDWVKEHLRNWLRLQKSSLHNRTALLKKIESEHALLEKSLDKLNPDDWLRPGVVVDWTVKDLLAHLSAWEGFFRNWYSSGLSNETPAIPAPGYSWRLIDEINQRILIDNRNRPLEVIRFEYLVSYNETLALVRSIPETDLYSVGRFAWTEKISLHDYISANTYNHYRWARSKLRAWKQSN